MFIWGCADNSLARLISQSKKKTSDTFKIFSESKIRVTSNGKKGTLLKQRGKLTTGTWNEEVKIEVFMEVHTRVSIPQNGRSLEKNPFKTQEKCIWFASESDIESFNLLN